MQLHPVLVHDQVVAIVGPQGKTELVDIELNSLLLIDKRKLGNNGSEHVFFFRQFIHYHPLAHLISIKKREAQAAMQFYK